MKVLDPVTVDAIANIIDRQYHPEKSGGADRFSSFLQNAGVNLPPHLLGPLHHCIPYVAWKIAHHLNGTADFELMLLRLASPLAYGGNLRQHNNIITQINRILKAEDLEIKFDGYKPSIGTFRESKQGQSQSESRSDQVQKMGNAVFVIHGRDVARKDTVVRFLREDLKLEALVLQEQIDGGRTVIEKIEHYANKAGFAVALLTPDDVGYRECSMENPRNRARQNVIFELGYFIGKLGRSRVRALKAGEVEMLSDYEGVIYTIMDDHGGWKEEMRRELQNAGLLDPGRA